MSKPQTSASVLAVLASLQIGHGDMDPRADVLAQPARNQAVSTPDFQAANPESKTEQLDPAHRDRVETFRKEIQATESAASTCIRKASVRSLSPGALSPADLSYEMQEPSRSDIHFGLDVPIDLPEPRQPGTRRPQASQGDD